VSENKVVVTVNNFIIILSTLAPYYLNK